jgi:uroporphyrin-III C-methyltransferase/precorrin-2 dehydrogenase/sirohydrochlorin ferrochelatase
MILHATEMRAAQIAPLARVPVFLALEGKRCIVAGGGTAALWKAELLAAAGAHVAVFAPASQHDMHALAAALPAGAVTVHNRRWTPADFDRAVIAVGACASEAEAKQFAVAARAAGVPVNVIDRPAFCDFTFGAIVNRSPLVIGISTDGAAPVFGQAIRAKIEALIPTGFARWAEAARNWRPRVQALGLSFRRRRNFWERFTDRAMAVPGQSPSESDLKALLAPASAEDGAVILVGTGPGDPELLTLRAVRALQSADVILFDSLVSQEILDFARREAKKCLVGKSGYTPSGPRDEIVALMVSLAKSGLRVVRLKGGDPMIGRADEEIAACRAAGIAIEVVPGVTAAEAAVLKVFADPPHGRAPRTRHHLPRRGGEAGGRRQLEAPRGSGRRDCYLRADDNAIGACDKSSCGRT